MFTAWYGLGIYIQFYVLPTQCIYVFFVWISEQTAIISLYSINWLVCTSITETECVYCAVRTESLYTILRSAHTVYLCVLCGSENKQRLFLYTALTGWFVRVLPRQRVFTARYGLSLYIQFYVLPTQCIYVFFVRISEQTAIISLYSINWLVCITEKECLQRGTD